MILLNFKDAGKTRLGVKSGADVIDVAAVQAALGVPPGGTPAPETLEALLAEGQPGFAALADLVRRAEAQSGERPWLRKEEALAFAPAVPAGGKIFLVGRNYRQHAAETGHTVTETPTLFGKFANSLAGHRAVVPLPATARKYDYEGELAVIIGRRAWHAAENEALSYVLGYCNAIDLSARDLQFLTSQWLIGKSLDKFLPLGPYIVTADEVGDPQDLQIRLWLNGELRQNARTSDMVFGVANLISYISQYIPLEPGDIISTGTPDGVIDGRADQVWLKPGDEVTVEVEKLGRLTSTLAAEQ